ncbi:MAG: thioredoxin family protein [Patescibacteria group bacterium]|nr:thioredoxin family protein [Patescibacteria group bacterium]
MSKESDKQARTVGLGVLIFVILFFAIIGFLYVRATNNEDSSLVSSSETNQESSPSQEVTNWEEVDKIGLAKKLTQVGAILFYGESCPYCHEQIEAFGSGAEFLEKIDCYVAENSQICTEKNIEGVPSWVYKDDKKSGKQSLDDLAAWVGYKKQK